MINHATNINKFSEMEIYTKKGTGKEIAKLMGVSVQMVSRALRGKSDTELARKIRTLAVRTFDAKVVKD